MSTKPILDWVFHPSDFTPESYEAFVHALAIATVAQSRFTILHARAGTTPTDQWSDFPGVRQTLERWGKLPAGSARTDVLAKLGMRVEKVQSKGLTPLRSTLNFVVENEVDLIVLATRGSEGLPVWLRGSKAEALARRSQTMTLFVPDGGKGFVSADTGEISLRRILVPVAAEPESVDALDRASRAAERMGQGGVEITLLHVKGGGPVPPMDPAPDSESDWKTEIREGDVIDEILAAAKDGDVDLIVMATDGRDGILDVAEIDGLHDLGRRHVREQAPQRLAFGFRDEIPGGVDDGRERQVDDALLRADPAQLAVAHEIAPQHPHASTQLADGTTQHHGPQRFDRGHHHLGAATGSKGEPVAQRSVSVVSAEDDVRSRVVRVGVHGV